jgi:hypothetical protein
MQVTDQPIPADANRDDIDAYPTPPPSFTTREEWTEWVMAPTQERPALPKPQQLKKMNERERQLFNRRRIRHHNMLGSSTIFSTPDMKEIHKELFELVELNQPVVGARFGYLISGDPMLGKSTIMTSFGKRYETGIRSRYPDGITATGDELVPVVYCSVAGDTTIKGLNRAICEFYGVPWSHKSKDALTILIQKLARRCSTSLFLIDDIHHLESKYRDHRLLNDHIKHLMSTVAATFVFAGIEAEKGVLLRETAGPSSWATQRRIRLYQVAPFSIKNKAERATWRGLLSTIERALVLVNAVEGDLWKAEDNDGAIDVYLFEQTGGQIGSLLELIRKAANRAIRDGSERITRSLLESVPLNRGRRAA